MPILKKFIGNDQIDGSKTLLLNDQALRSKDSSGVSTELMKFDSANVLQFLQMPQVSADPLHPNELARKSYVDNLAQGVAWKQVARAAIHAGALPAYTYANGTGGVGATITANANGAWNNAWSDSVAIAPTDRVVVYADGVAGIEYGIYVVTSLGDGGSPWVLTRSDDCDGSPSTGELLGATVTVVEGATHAGTTLRMNTPSPIIVGTTAMLWDHISSGLSYNFGDGLQLAGTDVSVKADAVGGANLAKVVAVSANGVAVHVDDASIGENMSGQLYVKAGGITAGMLDTSYLPLSGGTMTGAIDMGAQSISNAAEIIVTDGTASVDILGGGEIFIDDGAGSTLDMTAGIISLAEGSGESIQLDPFTSMAITAADGSNAYIAPTQVQVNVAGGNSAYMSSVELWSNSDYQVRSQFAGLTLDSATSILLKQSGSQFGAVSKDGADFKIAAQADLKLDSAASVKVLKELSMETHKIVNLVDPTANQDAATKKYVDDAVAGVNSAAEIIFTPYGNIAATNVQAAIQELDDEKLALAGGTMSGNIDMGNGKIENLFDPVYNQDAATKKYVDDGLALKLNISDFGTSFNTAFGLKTTSDLSEGSNLYYTQGRFDSAFALKSTDDLLEGVTNQYFTDARAKSAAVYDGITNGIHDVAPSQNAVFNALALKFDSADFSTSFSSELAAKSTSDLAEGTNLYFTEARAKSAAVFDGITDGVVDVAPSQNAVYDALALKADKSTSVQELVFESKLLTAPQIAAQEVTVASTIVGTPWIQVGTGSYGTRVTLEPSVDFEWSGSTITFKAGGPIATGGAEELVAGDKLSIYYMKSVTLG